MVSGRDMLIKLKTGRVLILLLFAFSLRVFSDHEGISPSISHDTSSPVVTEWSVTPQTVNIARGDAWVTIRLRVTDEGSGLDGGPLFFVEAAMAAEHPGWAGARLVQGDHNDGTFETRIRISSQATPGPFKVVLYPIEDLARNSTGFNPGGFSGAFSVISATTEQTFQNLLNSVERSSGRK